MTTREQIETAILQLPAEDFRRLVEWFHRLDHEWWDEQFEKDVQGGRLEALAEEAVRDFKAGMRRPRDKRS